MNLFIRLTPHRYSMFDTYSNVAMRNYADRVLDFNNDYNVGA